MGPGRYFSVRSLYLFECCLYYKGVFSECQRLSDCKYAKTVVHISFCFFAILHNAKHVQFLLRQTVRFSQTKEVQSYGSAAAAHADFILCGHLRRAADGQTADRRVGPVRAGRYHSGIRSGGCAHAGFRDSAALRSGADRHARGTRDFPQLRRTQKPQIPAAAERSAGHHHSQGDSSILASCGKCG